MKTLIFIIGAGHSGSTVLAKALNAHSKVFALSEISQFYDEINNDLAHCGCGVLLKTCPFWEDIHLSLKKTLGYGIKDMPNKFRISRELHKNTLIDKVQFKFSRILATHSFIKPQLVEERLGNVKHLFDTIIDKTGYSSLVDSSKSAKRAYLVSVRKR